MGITELLDVKPGVTAIIGGGGKTTLMLKLAEELKQYGRVIISTSTKIMRPGGVPVRSGVDEAVLEKELGTSPAVCVGVDCGGGKLTAPACSFELLMAIARYVLVEADGANGLPMKAHAAYEPVLPEAAEKVILVVGASGFGKTIRNAAHRPALYAQLAFAAEDDVLTPEHAARVIQAERLHSHIYVNQVESDTALTYAQALQTLLERPVVAGSLHKGKAFLCL